MSEERRAALASALERCESRFGSDAILTGVRATERRAASLLSLGVSSVDALLDGGLLASEPHLLVGEPTSGALSLALRAIAAAQRAGGEVAWIDAPRSFDPLAAERAGADLERLLVLHASGDDAVRAAATIARSAAFSLLVVDAGPRFAAMLSVDALAPVIPLVRAGRAMPLLVLAEERGRRQVLPATEIRRVAWLRSEGRTVGWRAVATRARGGRAVTLAFAPLALPSVDLSEEGAVARELEVAV